MFEDGRTHVHVEERSGGPSVVSDDLVQSVDKKKMRKTGLHNIRIFM
jgi:hypothetical protein